MRSGPSVGEMVNVTGPGPSPDARDTVSHGTLLAAVHGHPAVVLTLTDPVPPAAPMLRLVGAMEYVQPSDCVTLKRCPPTVIVPARGGPVVDSTSNTTV